MGKFTDITLPTYNTEWLPGKAQSPLPASVAAAAASAPDPDDVLQTENHDHHKLLQDSRHQNIKQGQTGNGNPPQEKHGFGVWG